MSSSLLCQLRLNRSMGGCGPETPVADVGVEAARWAIPSSRDVNIADEESSEESIGEEAAHGPRIPELACGVICDLLRSLESKPEENHEIPEDRREGAKTQDLGGLFTQVGAVRRRACGGVFSIRFW